LVVEREEVSSDGEFFDVDAGVVSDSHFDVAEVHARSYPPNDVKVFLSDFSEEFFLFVRIHFGSSVGGLGDGEGLEPVHDGG